MEIKCKKSKRFLCEVNYDEIIGLLAQYNVSLERPLKITIPCKNCKCSETYHIYKDHYEFVCNKSIDTKST